MESLVQFCAERLADLGERALRRQLATTDRLDQARALRDGRRVVSFSCNDYLGLSRHPQVKAAAMRALAEHGAGAGASRLVTGNYGLLGELEADLAAFKGAEAACVFGSGYLANIGIVTALMGAGDAVVLDELSHSCMFSGARLSGARVERFRHNDTADLAAKLDAVRGEARHVLVMTEGVFSMDGDMAPLPEIVEIAEAAGAWLLVDDAHALGVVGDGRGSAHAFGGTPCRVPLQMGTLSKAAGSYGGYLCGAKPVVDYVVNRARSLVFSTGLPPASAGAAKAALGLMARDPAFCRIPRERARLFTRLMGLPEAESPVVPIVVGEAEPTLAASAALLEQGFLVTAIRPPTVPEGTSRLRVTFSAAHSEDDVADLAAALKRLPGLAL